MTEPLLTGASRLELVDLSIIEQDDGFIVGNSAQGAFVQMPSIGVTVIERLRDGESIAEVTAGDVDVLDFAHTLLELGFVAAVDGTGWYAADIVAPAIWRVIRTLTSRLTSLPATSPRFWEALAFGALALLPLLLVA